jgi:hypothetical protein
MVRSSGRRQFGAGAVLFDHLGAHPVGARSSARATARPTLPAPDDDDAFLLLVTLPKISSVRFTSSVWVKT